MSGWGLSPASRTPEQGGPRVFRPGGPVSQGQLISPPQRTPPPPPNSSAGEVGPGGLRARPRLQVVREDLVPTAGRSYTTLKQFCSSTPNVSPQALDLLFFRGESITSTTTSWTGVLTNLLGRKATAEFSHVGVSYVGSDGKLALFEAVREHDTLFDIITQRTGKSGVRLVSLEDRIVRYARNKECYLETPDRKRIIRIGVMPFKVEGLPPAKVVEVMAVCTKLFEAFQDRMSAVNYTDSTKDLAQAQLPQLFGSNPVAESDAAAFCSKLACMVYMHANLLSLNFAASSETPSTLAALTLPLWAPFSLGPKLYTIYVEVPEVAWNLEYVVMARQRADTALFIEAQKQQAYQIWLAQQQQAQQRLQQLPPPAAASQAFYAAPTVPAAAPPPSYSYSAAEYLSPQSAEQWFEGDDDSTRASNGPMEDQRDLESVLGMAVPSAEVLRANGMLRDMDASDQPLMDPALVDQLVAYHQAPPPSSLPPPIPVAKQQQSMYNSMRPRPEDDEVVSAWLQQQ